MEPESRLGHRPLLVRLLGAAALGGAIVLLADPAGLGPAFANPNAMSPPPESSCQGNSCGTPSDDDDKKRSQDPEWDDLNKLDTLDMMHRKRRPNVPAGATGAGTADDEAAANAAVAAAAAARAAQPKSNIDMSDAMRAERCANNRARIAELERMQIQIRNYSSALNYAEQRSGQLFNDLPASSADYALVRAEVKELKTNLAKLGNWDDVQNQLAWHRNNLVALGCN